jgi:hypothetical protein
MPPSVCGRSDGENRFNSLGADESDDDNTQNNKDDNSN